MELYHNIAAKQSNSDELHLNRNMKRTHQESVQAERPLIAETKEIPPLSIKEKLDGLVQIPPPLQKMDSQVEDVGENSYYGALDAPRSSYQYTKNYELPTIASKMKQVAKCYLNTFNFKVKRCRLKN